MGAFVADGEDDDKGKAVKEAMAKQRPVKGSFAVIDGGKLDTVETEKPKRTRKPKAADADAGDDRPAPPPEAYDGVDAPPGGHDPAELEGARFCAKYDQNDRDNARRLIYWYGMDLAYVPGMGWIVFRTTHWVRDDAELEVSLRAQTVVDMIKLEALVLEHSPGAIKLLAAAKALEKKPQVDWSPTDHKLARSAENVVKALGERKSKRRAFAVTSGNRGRTVAMVAQAASMKAVDPKVLDANHMKFNVLNGTLTFSRVPDPEREEGSDRLAGHIEYVDHPDRADMITRVADVRYDPDATCPQFMKFLSTVQPDPVMRQFLQVGQAYAMLVGGNDEQVVFFHYGSGANGKSVFIEALGRLAGGYRAVVSPETFTGDQQKQGQQASPDIARLVNSRYVTVEELPRGIALKEGMIKAASGGTKMVARFLQKEFFEFDPMFVTNMSGNDMPSVSGTDYGIWRRLKIIPWGYTVPEADRMPFGDMMKMLDEERSGILNWLLDGLMLYLSVGLTPYIPATVKAFTEDYREERDPVGAFVDACVIQAEGRKVQASDMYAAYTKWCEANAMKPYQMTAFGLRMNTLGIRKEKTRLRNYLDVKLGEVPDIADPRPAPPSPAADDPGWTPPDSQL